MPGTTLRRLVTLVAGLVATALVAALLAGVPADAAKPTKGKGKGKADVAATYSGFKTGKVKTSGAFLGARVLDGTPVYRTDPSAKRASKAYGPASYVSVYPGSTPEATARAAWIVSKYGAFKKKVQSAALEVALDELLVGRTYALKGGRTKKRLAATGKAKKITKLAKVLLAGSITRAGDYTTSISTTPTVDVGAPVTSVVRVVAASTGAPVPSLPVTFGIPGQASKVVETGADGTATAMFATPAAGPRVVTALVDKVPENRLVVRGTVDPKASPVVLAQVKTARTLTAATIARARPALAVAGDLTDYTTGADHYATLSMAGSYPGAARAATGQIYGPFGDAASAATCNGPTYGAPTSFAVGDGATRMPRGPRLPNGGFYAWRVDVAGDAFNQSVAVCGAVLHVHDTPIVAATGSGTIISLDIDYLARGWRGTVRVATYGNFPGEGSGCAGGQTGGGTEPRNVQADIDGHAEVTFTDGGSTTGRAQWVKVSFAGSPGYDPQCVPLG